MRVIDNMALIDDNTGTYPVYLNTIINDHPTHVFPAVIYEADIEVLGYYVVYRTARPTDGVATEIQPVWVSDHYEQAWDVRPYTAQEEVTILEDTQRETHNLLAHQTVHELEWGLPYDFPDSTSGHAQLSLEHRVNMIGLHIDAGRHITDTTPDPQTPTMEYRVRERTVKILTPLQMQELTFYALDVYKEFYRKVWNLEYAIDTATQLSEIPVIPVSIMDEVIAELNTAS